MFLKSTPLKNRRISDYRVSLSPRCMRFLHLACATLFTFACTLAIYVVFYFACYLAGA